MKVKHLSNEKVLNYFAEVRGDASFFDFAMGDGLVTEGEKRAAERGAAARGTIGAKRDKCKKGKSCGAACIFYRKDCVLELPVNVQSSVSAARDYIMLQATTGGIDVEDAEQAFLRTTGLDKLSPDIDLTGVKDRPTSPEAGMLAASLKAQRLSQRHEAMKQEIETIKRESTNPREAGEKIRHALSLALLQGHQSRESSEKAITPGMQEALKSPKQQARFKELEDIYQNQKNGVYKTNKEFNDAMEKALSWYWKRDVSDAEVRLFIAAVPDDVAKRLLQKGDIKKGAEIPYWGTATPGRSTPTRDRPANLTPEQKREIDSMGLQANRHSIVKAFLDSNGLDVYTRQRVQLMSSDLEHTIPQNISGEQRSNSIANRTLTFGRINQAKSNLSFEQSLYENSGNAMYRASAGDSPKRTLLRELDTRTKTAAQVLSTASGLPKSELDAKGWRELNSGIITRLAQTQEGGATRNVSQAVNIGRTGGGKDNTQGWYLFGGKEGSGWDAKASTELGGRMARKLSEWEGQGPEGTAKIARLTTALLNTQRQANAINDEAWSGSPTGTIRGAGFAGDKQAKRHVENRIKEVMESNLPTINEILSQ
jgi:hypothetical protein